MNVYYKAPYDLIKANTRDAGWDLKANEEVTFNQFDMWAVSTGCSIEIIRNNKTPQYGYKAINTLGGQSILEFQESFSDFGLYVEVKGRSGMARNNKFITHVGTVDEDYHSDIGVVLTYMGKEPYTIKKGDRIAQLVFSVFFLVELTKTEDMAEKRLGFGSSGR